MKPLKKTTWDEIEIGEVFLYWCCYLDICIKTSKKQFKMITDDFYPYFDNLIIIPYGGGYTGKNILYKLRKQDQEKWYLK